MNDLEYKFATKEDVALLAEMNQQLIHDEAHRNPMTLPQFQNRMSTWLQSEYTAVLFTQASESLGYALYKKEKCP